MKINWNQKYNTIAVYAFLVIAAAFLFIMGIGRFDLVWDKVKAFIGMLSPFIVGMIIAYLMNFLLQFFENSLFPKLGLSNRLKKRGLRNLAMAISYLLIILATIAFINNILPSSINSITKLVNNTPAYARQTTEWLTKTIDGLELNEEFDQRLKGVTQSFLNNLQQFLAGLIPKMGNFLRGLMSGVTNLVLGFIISIYVLVDKEKFRAQSKMMAYSLLPTKVANTIISLFARINHLMKRYLAGQVLEATIVGIAFLVVLMIMKVEYAGLMAFILGFTNMIPWIGPWIGSIPAGIIILFQSPIKTVWFAIAVLVIQQIDGNILAPRIHGDSMGVSAFWILFALLIGGAMFGVPGMLIGVPFFVLIYSIVREFVQDQLSKKNLPVDSEDYKAYGIQHDAEDSKES